MLKNQAQSILRSEQESKAVVCSLQRQYLIPRKVNLHQLRQEIEDKFNTNYLTQLMHSLLSLLQSVRAVAMVVSHMKPLLPTKKMPLFLI
jgi:hypothetical protein